MFCLVSWPYVYLCATILYYLVVFKILFYSVKCLIYCIISVYKRLMSNKYVNLLCETNYLI